MRRTLRITQLGAQRGVGCVVVVIAIDVADQLAKPVEGFLVDSSAELDEAVASALAQLLNRPARLSNADDRHVQCAVLHHALQSRKDLFVSQITGGAKKNKCIRML